MRVLVNGHAFQSPSTRDRGIGRYARMLLAGIVRARPDWSIELLEFAHLEPVDRDTLPTGVRVRRIRLTEEYVPTSPESRWRAEAEFADWLATDRPSLVLSMSTCESDAIMPATSISGVPHAVVVHDLIPVLYAPVTLSALVWTAIYSERLAVGRDADLRLANSDSTAADYRRLFPTAPGEIVNIGGTTDGSFTADGDRTVDDGLLRQRGIGRPFLFVGGGDCWRKNIRGCVAAFARLPRATRDGYELVIAGTYPSAERRRISQLAADVGVQYQVRQLGRVSDAELAALYRRCRAFLFPSLYEGLGLPIVEALRCGAPVVTSDTSSLPEYAGPDAHYCDPLDPESIATAVAAAISEPTDRRRPERIWYGYKHTVETVGAAATGAIDRLLAGPPVRNRPRLAWFAELRPPFGAPPEDIQRMAELSRDYVIEIVCQSGMTDLLPALRMNYPIIPVDLFEARHRAVGYAGAVAAVPPEADWLPDHGLSYIDAPCLS